MHVTSIDITPFSWQTPPWKTGMGRWFGGEKTMAVMSVHTDEGITGHAFLGSFGADASAFIPGVMDHMLPIVRGRDPWEGEAIWRDMWKLSGSVPSQCISAMDIALWDIRGKAASLPIHRMLGTSRDRVPVYSSTAWHATAEEYAEEASEFMARGWAAHKLHPHGVADDDIEISRAVRKAVGDDMKLMLDVTWAYDYYDALRVGRAIEDLDYYWYEDPLPATDIYSYHKLKSALTIPVVATEAVPGKFYGMAQWIQAQTTDMLRGDVGSLGGITPLLKTAHLAEGFNMSCEIFHGGNSVDSFANLHVIMAIRNCQFFEVFPPNGDIQYGLVNEIKVDPEGFVHAPEGPGLGIEIDWDLIHSRRVDL